MKVVCAQNISVIDFQTIAGITPDKTYEVFNYGDHVMHFLIIDDFGVKTLYNTRYFISLDIYRQKKLIELGI
jgi:hypothetical protein